MPDFGYAGTRTATVYNPEVTVAAAPGEYLHYTLVASGGMPAFTYTCADRDPISRSDQFPGRPRANYEWRLQKSGGPLPVVVAADRDTYDAYSVAMSFLGIVGYDLTVDLCKSDGTVKKTIQQISYSSTDSRDYYAEPLGVSWV